MLTCLFIFDNEPKQTTQWLSDIFGHCLFSAKIQQIGKSVRLKQSSIKPASLENDWEDSGSADCNYNWWAVGNPSSVRIREG